MPRHRPPRTSLAVAILLSVLSSAASRSASGQCLSGTNAALHFDGDDLVTVGNVPAGTLDGFQDFTFEAWFRRTGANSSTVIAKSHPAAILVYSLRVDGDVVQFYYNNGGTITSVPGPFPGVGSGAWHHIAVTRLGSVVSIYGDGQLLNTGMFMTPLLSATARVTLGAQMNNDNASLLYSFHQGGLDEVRVWSTARSQAEIASSLDSVLAGNEPGLRTYWKLDDGAGQNVMSSATGGGLTGVLGAHAGVLPDDPTWTFASTAPILHCLPGTGQANSAAASLRVNGVGYPGVNGPYYIQVPQSGLLANRVTLTWQGPPNAPLLLAAGTLQPNAAPLPCSGSLDLSLAGLAIVGDFFTSPFPLNHLFLLDANGHAETSFTVPSSVLGQPWVSLQGAVASPGCAPIPYRLTAAFEIR